MLQRGLLRFIYECMEFITRIAYINILWMLFTLAGLVIFGFGPATAAMFHIVRHWAEGSEPPVFRTFWLFYKKNFIKANLLILPLFIISNILYIDFRYLALIDGMFFNIMLFVFINATILFLVILLYTFPVFVHFNYTFLKNYKTALAIGFFKPLHTLGMAAAIYLVWRLVIFIPGLLPLFPAGLLAYIMMRLAFSAFNQLENKTGFANPSE